MDISVTRCNKTNIHIIIMLTGYLLQLYKLLVSYYTIMSSKCVIVYNAMLFPNENIISTLQCTLYKHVLLYLRHSVTEN